MFVKFAVLSCGLSNSLPNLSSNCPNLHRVSLRRDFTQRRPCPLTSKTSFDLILENTPSMCACVWVNNKRVHSHFPDLSRCSDLGTEIRVPKFQGAQLRNVLLYLHAGVDCLAL